MNELCPVPGCRVDHVTRLSPQIIQLSAHSRRDHGRCPDCGRISNAVHSRYHRNPADLPSLGREVRLSLRVRRFYCRNPACGRRTFTERLPTLLLPNARRTQRLAQAQGRIGVALGGEAGSRLLPRLAMPTSADTLLRLVRRLPLPARRSPRVLGVDDWAMKRGRTYGTILVDLERRCVTDLLPDRSAATLAGWLQNRPQIKVIARDRSTEYARGVSEGARKATQVADRWHLLANAREMVERWLSGIHGRLRKLPPLTGDAAPSARRIRAFPRTQADAAIRADSRARRQAVYAEVRRRHVAGEPLLAIGRAMGLARGTVRRFAYAASFPERAVRAPGRSIIDPYLEHLNARVTAGCENASALWRDLRALGFAGSSKQVRRWLTARRTSTAKTTPHKWRSPKPAPSCRSDAAPALPSPRQLAWLLVRPTTALNRDETTTSARVEQDAQVARIASLARRFCTIVRDGSVDHCRDGNTPLTDYDAWLVEARSCGIRAVETFAAGLEQDGAAVRAALTLPWSSAQAEGQITKLKLLKRSMYGRAGFDLLRRRILLAA
jgi:transposase